MNLSTAHLSKQYQVVGGKRRAYHERGGGDAIVFLHSAELIGAAISEWLTSIRQWADT
jgi:hypothetical protein